MSSSTVNVAGISSSTSEKEVRDFFSFCGKIKNITIKNEGSTKTAEVAFEKDSAAKTALLLDSTQLGDAQVHVTSAAGVDPMSSQHDHDDQHEIAQEDKPRSRIMAEYLAHGYRLGDNVIQRGLAFDSQHGISSRFTQTLQNFDKKYDASGKTKSVDEKYQISNKAYGAFGGLQSYFESALDTPTGQKIRAFYEQGSKQVQDVHTEAVRLSGLNNKPATVSGTSRTTCKCGSDTKDCPCAPGTCACSSCAKNPDEKDTSHPDSKPHQIKGTERTACNCQADPKNCPCDSGTCACAGCSKNPDASSSSSGGKFEPHDIKGTKRTACSCQAAESKCGCPPGNCACSSCKKNPDAESSSGNKPQKVAGADRTTCNCGSDTANCPCAPGTCACASCAKNPDEKSSHPSNGYTPQKISGSDRTACKCQAKDEVCGCAPGTCACAKCSKNPDSKQESGNKPEKVGNTDRTTCNCGADTKNCPCAPGTCACGSCAKNPDVKAGASAEEMDMHKVEGNRTECKCGSTAEKCPCAPGTCACGSCAKNPDAQKA